MSADFEREDRYYVIKIKEAMEALDSIDRAAFSKLLKKVEDYRNNKGKPPLECAVVESDWLIYNQVWGLIEQQYALDTMSHESQEDEDY